MPPVLVNNVLYIRPSPWDETLRVDLLKAKWAEGLSASEIARDINRETKSQFTRMAIIGKAMRLKLPQRSPRKNPEASKRRPRSPTRTARLRTIPMMAPEPIIEVADADIPLAQRKTIMELDNQHCRWICGEPKYSPDYFFCGSPTADVLDGRSYCAAHARRVYTQPRTTTPSASTNPQR